MSAAMRERYDLFSAEEYAWASTAIITLLVIIFLRTDDR